MKELVKALIGFQADVGKIEKDAKAQYGKFADLAGVLGTIKGPLGKNGLAIIQTFEEEEDGTYLITTLAHVSGESTSSRVKLIIPSGGRNPLHTFGGSVTYERRYSIQAILNLVADIDTDGNEPAGENPPVKKAAKPVAAPAKPAKVEDVATDDEPLSSDERGLVMDLLKEVHQKDQQQLQELTVAFRKQFNLPEDIRLSQAIQTQSHVNFVNDFISHA